jgi:hypothetical protein
MSAGFPWRTVWEFYQMRGFICPGTPELLTLCFNPPPC